MYSSINFICFLGQHLISAIFERDFGYNTTTWYLGLTTSFVELDSKTITAEQLKIAENKINSIIANGANVSVINVNSENNDKVPIEVS